jgi:hypothetical protein
MLKQLKITDFKLQVSEKFWICKFGILKKYSINTEVGSRAFQPASDVRLDKQFSGYLTGVVTVAVAGRAL